MTITARFDGRVFVPESTVSLPVGHRVHIDCALSADPIRTPDLLADLRTLPVNPDWPSDGAEHHDHYLYGTPKSS